MNRFSINLMPQTPISPFYKPTYPKREIAFSLYRHGKCYVNVQALFKKFKTLLTKGLNSKELYELQWHSWWQTTSCVSKQPFHLHHQALLTCSCSFRDVLNPNLLHFLCSGKEVIFRRMNAAYLQELLMDVVSPQILGCSLLEGSPKSGRPCWRTPQWKRIF